MEQVVAWLEGGAEPGTVAEASSQSARLLTLKTRNSAAYKGVYALLMQSDCLDRRERWAWFALWFYPAFWLVHLVGRLPPSKDHVHQVVFIVLSLAGLLLPVREFFRTGIATGAP